MMLLPRISQFTEVGHSNSDGEHNYFAKKSDRFFGTKPDMLFSHIVGRRGAYVRSSAIINDYPRKI